MKNERAPASDPLSVYGRNIASPVAAPVDTFVRPAKPAPSKADTLLGALTEFNPAFGQVIGQYRDEAIDRETTEGKELFEKNRTAFADAVRKGDIPPGASPFVRQGYRKSRLSVLGAQYNIGLKRELEHSNLADEEDPAAVEAFIADYDARFIKANGIEALPDNEVGEVFRPMTQRAQDGFRNSQAQANIQLVEEKRFRSFEQELYLAVSQGRFSGPPGSAAADATNLTAWLNARAKDMYEEGLDYADIEKAILQTVGDAALKNGSLATANILDRVSVGGMPAIGQSRAGRALDARITAQVVARERARNAAAARATRSASTTSKRALQSQAQAAAMAGDLETAREIIAELNKVDPTGARSVDGFIRRYEGDIEDAAEEGAYAATRGIVAGAGSATAAQEIINEATIMGNLTAEDANRLHTLSERLYDNDTPSPLDALEQDRAIIGQRSRLGDVYPTKDPISGFPIPANADRAAQAEDAYDDYMIDWIGQNSDEDGNYDRLAARKAAQEAAAYARDVVPIADDPFASVTSDDPSEEVTDPATPDWAK